MSKQTFNARFTQPSERLLLSEIGQQEQFGFVVRALDEGGLVFENTEARTLDEGMTALERGIAEQSDDEGIGFH